MWQFHFLAYGPFGRSEVHLNDVSEFGGPNFDFYSKNTKHYITQVASFHGRDVDGVWTDTLSAGSVGWCKPLIVRGNAFISGCTDWSRIDPRQKANMIIYVFLQ